MTNEQWSHFVKANTNCPLDSIEKYYIHNIETLAELKGSSEAIALSQKARTQGLNALEAKWLADPTLWVCSPLKAPPQP